MNQPDNFINRLKNRSRNNPFWPFFLFLGVAALLYFGQSMVYSVGPEENAVILKFGKYDRTEGSGLHFKLPYVPGILPIEEVIKVPVKIRHKFEVGFRTVSAGVRSQFEKTEQQKQESLMLTGDLNVIDVEWIVQFEISNARDFLFNVRNVGVNLFDLSQSSMREVIGDRTVNEVLTTGAAEIEQEALERMQSILNEYKMGIQIIEVKLQDVNPPELVKPSFNEVNSAKQEAEQVINEAWKEYNKVVPEARGKAERTLAEAEGYKTQLINQAIGDSKRFQALYEEYKKAPDITRKRLYFEKMRTVLQNSGNLTVIDPEFKNLLPLMRLDTEKP